MDKTELLMVKERYPYSTLEQIMDIADKNKNGTINLKEFKILYPNAAFLFKRFDSNHNGEIDLEELKNLLYTDELATKMLQKLQKKEYEKNIIKIVDLIKDLKFESELKNVKKKEERKKIEKQKKQDLFKSISLKDLNFKAADYLITRFDLKESVDLSIEELKKHINSYAISKEFLNTLEVKRYEWAVYAMSALVFASYLAYSVKKTIVSA